MNKAKVYLIPNLLGSEAQVERSLPSVNASIIKSLSHFAVENIRDTRRFLVKLGLKEKIDQSEFFDLNKRSKPEDLQPILNILKAGNSVGVVSDAGCPGVADPGALLVKYAHKNGFQVVPLIGPSSILMALMASGLNGQSFAFCGYLDREKQHRIKEIKELEKRALQLKQTQIFMETPYRNEVLWDDLINHLNMNTQLCVAANISLPSEYIKCMSVSEWKKYKKPMLKKIPAVFLLSV